MTTPALPSSLARTPEAMPGTIAIWIWRCGSDPPQGLALLDVINILSNMAQKEVDLVVLNRASAFLRHQIIKEGIRFLIKDPVGYRQFREKTMIDYDIYKHITGLHSNDRSKLIGTETQTD